MAVNVASEGKRQGQVMEQVVRLRDIITGLEEGLLSLAERLAAVRFRNEPPSLNKEVKPEVPTDLAPLANCLRSQNWKLEYLRKEILSMAEEIEL